MSELVEFFDRNSEAWDGYLKPRDYEVAAAVLERTAVGPNDKVLDVACGTGVLEALLLARGAADITAMDISPGMEAVFRRKFPKVKFVLGDYHDAGLFAPSAFSRVLIYNAFPHFRDPGAITQNAAAQLAPGGRLVIAHSMTRAQLDWKHAEVGGIVGNHMLVSDEKIMELLLGAGFTDVLIEDDAYFFVSAKRTQKQRK
ncbi:MAG TPA: class I SAM-dependent methyltransferase [Elusimicrobiales bacterium]|nr:class I SAM-dependent methyltransferase [Elusimicrobiales bacterium]